MHTKEYIEKIVSNGNKEDMEKLSTMFQKIMYDMKETNKEKYSEYKSELYELANGKVLTEEMAKEWVTSMKPVGEHWNIEETTNAMKSLGYNLSPIDFYAVANMQYNDYYDLVKEDDMLALKLAYNWLNDTDAVDSKVYEYYKYIVK